MVCDGVDISSTAAFARGEGLVRDLDAGREGLVILLERAPNERVCCACAGWLDLRLVEGIVKGRM